MTKVAHGLPNAVMSDMIVGGDSSHLDKAHNFIMRCLDETFSNLVNINSLSIWVPHFELFAESVCYKCFSH